MYIYICNKNPFHLGKSGRRRRRNKKKSKVDSGEKHTKKDVLFYFFLLRKGMDTFEESRPVIRSAIRFENAGAFCLFSHSHCCCSFLSFLSLFPSSLYITTWSENLSQEANSCQPESIPLLLVLLTFVCRHPSRG